MVARAEAAGMGRLVATPAAVVGGGAERVAVFRRCDRAARLSSSNVPASPVPWVVMAGMARAAGDEVKA
jgi:hypothetical protein